MNKLTRQQKNILDFIVDYIRDHQISPSYSEIGERFGVSSPATVYEHVKALEAKGYLKTAYNEKRSISLTDKVASFVQAFELPLVGLITAGEPIEALQGDDSFAVPSILVKDPVNSYVLKVKGESMIEEGIMDGDYVIVERNPSPKNGDVVVALLDNAYATLKKFFRETNRIRLQPANKTMQPIYVQDPTIQGVVRAIIRQFRTA